jgi:hypothetical protein
MGCGERCAVWFGGGFMHGRGLAYPLMLTEVRVDVLGLFLWLTD